MAASIVVELPSGNKILFGGGDAAGGLAEIGIGEDFTKATGEKLKAALGSLGELVAMIEEAVGRMARRPDRIEVEFCASLSGKCDLKIVSGEGEAEFKVTLEWGAGA